MKIYHNPRCRKSRETLTLINSNGIAPEIIEYLKTPPNETELKSILVKLNIEASALVRKEESIFKETYKGKELTNDEWVKVLVQNPKLIQRPIVISGNKAIIGRPPENVLELID